MIPRILNSHCCRQILVHFRSINHHGSMGVAYLPPMHRMARAGTGATRELVTLSSGDRRKGSQGHGERGSDRYHRGVHPGRHMLFGGFIGTIASSLGLEEKEKEDPDPLTTAIKRGIYYLDTGHHDLCDTTLHEALELARSASNEKAIDYIYVILADNAMAMRELTKAEALYKETLRRILASNAKEDDESVIEISLQLATIYAERKEYENAEEGFAFCIQKQKNRIKDIDIDKDLTEEQINSLALYGMILDWYSKYCQMRKNYKLAADYTRQALRLSRKTLGELHEQTLVLMSDLAVITEQNGDLDKAIEILKEVVQRASSINAEGLSTFFYNLGMCYMKKNDGHNAFYCCTRATRYADKLGRKDKVFNNARNCMVKSRRLMIEDQLAQED